MNVRRAAVALSIAAMLTLTGCNSSDEQQKITGTPSTVSVGSGQWFTYKDGLQIQVISLKRFTLSQTSAGGNPRDPGVVATVVIKNGTTGVIDLRPTTVKLTYGPDGDEAEMAVDIAQGGIGIGFRSELSPQQSDTAKFGFIVPETQTDQLAVDVQPGSGAYESAHFEGAVR